jgi:hypothetical protein
MRWPPVAMVAMAWLIASKPLIAGNSSRVCSAVMAK